MVRQVHEILNTFLNMLNIYINKLFNILTLEIKLRNKSIYFFMFQLYFFSNLTHLKSFSVVKSFLMYFFSSNVKLMTYGLRVKKFKQLTWPIILDVCFCGYSNRVTRLVTTCLILSLYGILLAKTAVSMTTINNRTVSH